MYLLYLLLPTLEKAREVIALASRLNKHSRTRPFYPFSYPLDRKLHAGKNKCDLFPMLLPSFGKCLMILPDSSSFPEENRRARSGTQRDLTNWRVALLPFTVKAPCVGTLRPTGKSHHRSNRRSTVSVGPPSQTCGLDCSSGRAGEGCGRAYHASVPGSLLGLEEDGLLVAADGALLVRARELERSNTSAAGS